MPKIPKVSLKGVRKASWLDPFSMSEVKGEEFFYLVKDDLSGEWLFKVRVPKDENKITINVVESSEADFIYDLIKRRTIVFIRGKYSDLYYHPLSMAHLGVRGLSYKRLHNIKKVPDYLLYRFDITAYKELKHNNKPGFGVVAIVPKGVYEKMVELFVLEIIWPIFNIRISFKRREASNMNLLEQFLRNQGLMIIAKDENELEVWNGTDVASISSDIEVISCSTRQGRKKFEKLLRLYMLWRKFMTIKSE